MYGWWCIQLLMAPRLSFHDWLGKEKCKGTAVANVGGAKSPEFCLMGKSRGRNARQFTWVLLLKAHRIISCITWMAAALWTLLGVIKRRLIFRQGVSSERDKPGKGRILFAFIRGFSMVSSAALVLEIVAYCNGWYFHIPHTADVQGWMHSVYLSWIVFRANYIAHAIQVLSNFCVFLFIVQSVDRMILCFGCFWIKFKKIKPRVEGSLFNTDDLEGFACEYPMVLNQIPMCNEKEVN